MMLVQKPNSLLIAMGLTASLVIQLSAQTKKQEPPDFNGDFRLTSQQVYASNSKEIPNETLHVVQTARTLMATSTSEGKSSTRTLDLSGQETRTTTPDGGERKDRSKLNSKGLVIDSVWQTGGHIFNIKETWTLSRDGQSLKIETVTSSPVSARGLSTSIDWRNIEKYARIATK
jgi:hypothetical protein